MYSWDTLGSPHRSLARHIWNALSIYMTLLYILRSKVSLRYKTQCLNDTYMDRSGRSHKRLWFQYADWSSFQIIYSTRNWRINKIPDLFLLFLKKKNHYTVPTYEMRSHIKMSQDHSIFIQLLFILKYVCMWQWVWEKRAENNRGRDK